MVAAWARRAVGLTMRKAVAYLPFLLFAMITALELLVIFLLNEGQFVYTLDDPYIHLALAENIARGHYGLNHLEYSAPSSSILWPFMLVPFSMFKLDHHAPLLINVLASIGTVALFGRVVAIALSSLRENRRYVAVGVLVTFLILAVNLVGLVFTGMEHSLQLLLSVAVVAGMIDEHRTRAVPWWLVAGLVLGPLVRYENLALSVPALGYLAYRRHRAAFWLAAGLLAVTLAGFSLFLHSLNLGLVPASVLVKSRAFASGSMALNLLMNLVRHLFGWPQALMVAGLLLLFYIIGFRRGDGEGAVAAWAAAGVVLHLLAGAFGYFYRYEIYMFASVLLILLYLYRENITRLIEDEPISKIGFFLGAMAVLIFPTYVRPLLVTPWGSNNIYEQQYQMHRFATEYYKAPIAVNDLGWVKYRNENDVLDVIGFTSREVLGRYRTRKGKSPQWMDEAARKYDVKMAMLYDEWFPVVPERWTRIGQLHLGKKKITPAYSEVTFYALDRTTLRLAERLLREFETTLPRGVRFTFEKEAGGEGPS